MSARACAETRSFPTQTPRLLQMRVFAPYFEGKPATINAPAIIRSTPLFPVRRHPSSALN